MTILCLHGSYGSAANFKVQLSPFVDAVEKRDSIQFKWINGAHSATPPPSFENYFGAPPHYRFIDYDGVNKLDDMLTKIREFPEGSTPEDTMRKLLGEQEISSVREVVSAVERIFEILDEDPEIDGVLGYSEGAALAATLILEERRRWEEEGKARRIKCAFFFAGWPPLSIRGDSVKCLLADECEDVIDVPTCHIVGCNDPYADGAVALFEMCDEDTATLFDHGKGHTVPRDTRIIGELASAIEGTWKKRLEMIW